MLYSYFFNMLKVGVPGATQVPQLLVYNHNIYIYESRLRSYEPQAAYFILLFFFLAQLTELAAGMAAHILLRRLTAVRLKDRRQRLKRKHFRKDRVVRRSSSLKPRAYFLFGICWRYPSWQ